MKLNNNKGLIKRIFIMIFVIVLIIVLPMVKLAGDDNIDLIYRSFVGKKSDYQGFIEIWNIDSFDSGKMTKADFLQEIAKEFQKKNKGTYVIVRNVTESECNNMLSGGQRPDLISCSYGVAGDLKEYVQPFSANVSGVYSNFLKAGIMAGEQYAIPWCFGNYYLFSTTSRVEEWFAEGETVELSKIALDTGREKIGKKKTEITYSIGFGSKKYLLPQIAFRSYTKKEIVSANYAIDKISAMSNTPYGAYTEFLTQKTNILLGTQSELIKLKKRESLGKLDGLIVEEVAGFTDLLQFMFILKNTQDRFDYAQKFVEFLLDDKNQKSVKRTGMRSVKKEVMFSEIEGAMSSITPDKIESYVCYNVFLSKSEIESLQLIC